MKKLVSINLILGLFMVLSSITVDVPKEVIAPHLVAVKRKNDRNHTKGTAFYVMYNGKSYILTNKHICDGKRTLYTADGPRKILKEAKYSDLCLVESKRNTGLKIASKPPQSLDMIHLLGFPMGHQLTARFGRIVGNVAERFRWVSPEKIEVTHVAVPAFPGSSGSPVCDKNGRLIGVLFSTHAFTYEDSYMVPHKELLLFLARHAQ